MEGVESKSQSAGQDDQFMAENSVFLAENVEGFQQNVKEAVDLIEQDENLSEITPEIYKSKKSKLTKMVTELSRMHMALADENIHLVKELSKNTHRFTTPIKTEHAEASSSACLQVTESSKTPEFMTPVGYELVLNSIGGGFNISTKEGSESSFTLSSTSGPKNDAPKAKKPKVHNPEVLLNKIAALEKEVLSLKKKIQELTDENAILEAEKANVAELKRMLGECHRKIKTMGGVLEASRQQVIRSDDENAKMKKEMSNKVFGKVFNSVEKQNMIDKQVEQIAELNAQIDQLKLSHAADVDRLNTENEMLKTRLKQSAEFMEDLKNLLD